jgi:outer membrane receptor for ferrienterochelin and colicins
VDRAQQHCLQLFIIVGLAVVPLFAYGQAGSPPTLNLQAEEKLLLQEIPSVYGASKYEQKVTEAPASVSIVTADEIKKFGYRTLADILRSVRGFYVSYDRNYSYVGVRGFARPGDYNSRILVLVNGHRLNDNVFDSALIGTEGMLDVDLIERVEIIRGPSSSLYGSNAFFAVVDIITKRGRDFQGAEVSGEVGSFDTYKGRLSYGRRFSNEVEGLLSGTYYSSEGQRLFYKEFNDPATNNGVAAHSDDDRSYSVFGLLSWRDFTLQGAYSSREKGIPTGSFGTVFNDPQNRTVDERAFIDLQYAHIFNAQWEIMARLYYDRYYYRGHYLYDYPPLTLNEDLARGARWGGEFQTITRVLPRQTITLGAEYRNNLSQKMRNFDQEPFFSYLDVQRNSTNWALYAQDEIILLKNLILNLGVRYDYYDSFGGTINPRLALIYNPFRDTTLKLLYGTAFRAPNVYERFFQGLGFKSSPSLEPETITTYELILEQYMGPHLRGTASAFYYNLDKLITQRTDPRDELLVFQNAGRVTAYGGALEIEGKWANGWTGRVSYAYQETQDQQTGARLTNSPRHIVKGNLLAPLFQDKLFLGPELQYTSSRKTLAGRHTPGFVLANVTLFSQHLLKGLEVSASVYNLFNTHYGDPGAEEHRQDVIPQDGRSFRFKITYGF